MELHCGGCGFRMHPQPQYQCVWLPHGLHFLFFWAAVAACSRGGPLEAKSIFKTFGWRPSACEATCMFPSTGLTLQLCAVYSTMDASHTILCGSYGKAKLYRSCPTLKHVRRSSQSCWPQDDLDICHNKVLRYDDA